MNKFSLTERAKSFGHAGRGISIFIKNTHNAWLQIIAAAVVALVGWYFHVTVEQWLALIFAFGLVFVTEALNTAIEVHMNLTSPEFHPRARDTKDIAAGAVLISAVTALIIGIIIFVPYFCALGAKPPATDSAASIPVVAVDFKNATYRIENTPVRLGQVSPDLEETISYFGNEARGDLNGDGIPDVAFIVTAQGSGSGTFFYAAAAVGTTTGYVGTNGISIGDRIAPQSTEIKNGELIVNYADRADSDPMSSMPTVATTKYFKIVNGELVSTP